MSKEIPHNSPTFKQNAFEKAEGYNYQPTSQERQGRLVGMYLTGAGMYPGIPLEPKSQEEIVMYRLGRGKGGPVGLPELQQDEHGKGFISQFTARVHALKNRHGFRILNRVDYTSNPVKSWYWVQVNESGFPVLDSVPMAERKTGTPKTSPRTAKNSTTPRQSSLAPIGSYEEIQAQDEHGQSLLFGDLGRRLPPSNTGKTFADRERGA